MRMCRRNLSPSSSLDMNSLAFTVVEDFAGSYLVAFLCSIMILGGAFLLIYNVLSITLGNDIRQYGLLKTIGTTNSQIRKIVFRQTGKVILAGCLIGASGGLSGNEFVLPGTLGELYLQGMGSARGMTGFLSRFFGSQRCVCEYDDSAGSRDRCPQSDEAQSYRVCPL